MAARYLPCNQSAAPRLPLSRRASTSPTSRPVRENPPPPRWRNFLRAKTTPCAQGWLPARKDDFLRARTISCAQGRLPARKDNLLRVRTTPSAQGQPPARKDDFLRAKATPCAQGQFRALRGAVVRAAASPRFPREPSALDMPVAAAWRAKRRLFTIQQRVGKRRSSPPSRGAKDLPPRRLRRYLPRNARRRSG